MASKTQYNKNLALVIITIAVFFIGLSQHLTERLFAHGLYPITSAIQRFFSSLLPFAIGDFLYALLAIWICSYLIGKFRQNIRSKNRLKYNLLAIGKLLVLLYLLFKISWGLNYSRPPLAESLHIGHQKYDSVQLAKLANDFANKLVLVRSQLAKNPSQKPRSTADFIGDAVASYQKMATKNKLFNYRYASVKSVVFPTTISKMGIEGYYNPLSGEANINTFLPWFTLPFTTCHEIAHQTGVAKEDEANLMGFLTAINSDNVYFQYSGYYNVFRNILLELRIKSPEAYKKLYAQLPSVIINDFKTERNFWLKYNGDMSTYTSLAFDQILKMNNQRKGIDSYQDIVLWVYNWNLKEKRL